MEKWPVCPKCNEEMKLFKIKGNVQIVGGYLELKCKGKGCGALVEISGTVKHK